MDTEKNEDLARIRKAVDELGEHFDTVQIFASRHESGEHDGTLRITLGVGNWFARYGQVHCWLLAEDESTRNQIPRKVNNESDH